MKLKIIIFYMVILVFLNGCFQTTAMVGPTLAFATTGNIIHSGFSYGANKVIKDETGKDTTELLISSLEEANNKSNQSKYINKIRKDFQLFFDRIMKIQKK